MKRQLQNLRIVWVGRGFKGHLSPPLPVIGKAPSITPDCLNRKVKYPPKNTVSFLVVLSPLMSTDFNSASAENS